MRCYQATFLVLSAFFLTFFGLASGHAVEIAKDGLTNWKIVTPKEPTLVEKTAARELASHLKEMTSADFPVVSEGDEPIDSPCFWIGRTSKAPKKDFRFDEIFIQATESGIVFAGHEKRGCLYAVYSFLQDTLGVRWWAPDETTIPKKNVLIVDDNLLVEYAPTLISREMYHRAAQPTVFSARMKGNGFLTPEYGGAVRILNFVHSFYKYIPPNKYFERHPEWFSEIEGRRTHDRAQLCLTNEELQAEVIRNVLEALRKNPETKIVDLSQNDWYGFCTCEKCRALDEKEESHAGSLIHFVNAVAEGVEKEFPDVLVETLAYQYTRKPPKFVKPRDNVLIRLCTIECSFIQPLESGEKNQDFARDFAGWSAISKSLFIWDYVTNYNDYIGPHPNWGVLGKNLRYFVKNSAIGLFEEGEGDDFVEMRNWALMRLMWEPFLDEEKLYDEFCCGYYGEEAAPLLKEYRALLIKACESSGIHLGCFGANSSQWLDVATLNQATRLMNEAAQLTKSRYGENSDEFRRLRKTKLAIDHVWLSRFYPLRCEARASNLPFEGPQNPFEAAESFAKDAKSAKIRSASIHQEANFDLYLEGLQTKFLIQKTPPDICANLPEDAWIGFDAISFANYKNVAEVVVDPRAWNGKSVKMGTKVDWNTNFAPPVRGKYRLLASLRCEGAIPTGKLGSWGVYDPIQKKGCASQTLKSAQFLTQSGEFDPEFRWIDMGVVDFTPGSYFWFAHGHDPALEAIFVDRVVLIDTNFSSSVEIPHAE
ncbi:MAG: DUF4838 domain-containing protein [Planctomycetia bacterium]|nr:DUF4838 domain-containing protein [Planctomycetia bacterium]